MPGIAGRLFTTWTLAPCKSEKKCAVSPSCYPQSPPFFPQPWSPLASGFSQTCSCLPARPALTPANVLEKEIILIILVRIWRGQILRWTNTNKAWTTLPPSCNDALKGVFWVRRTENKLRKIGTPSQRAGGNRVVSTQSHGKWGLPWPQAAEPWPCQSSSLFS